ncbi:hypothetical protein V8C34DRAFT_276053 [Trichoderma compactum]
MVHWQAELPRRSPASALSNTDREWRAASPCICASRGKEAGRRIAAKVARLMHHKAPIICSLPRLHWISTEHLQLICTTDGTDGHSTCTATTTGGG